MPDTIRVIALAKQGPAGPPGGFGQFATATDPAIDAAVTTAIIDANDGVVITTTTTGNAQTLQPPTDTETKRFFTVTNASTSTDPVSVNGNALQPGFYFQFLWEGSAWVSSGA